MLDSVVATSWQTGIPLWLCVASIAGFALSLGKAVVANMHARARHTRAHRTRAQHTRAKHTRTQTAPRQPRERARAGGVTSPVVQLPPLGAALLAGLLSSAAAMLALALTLPLDPAARALLSVVLWPVLWAGISLYSYGAESRRRAYRRIAVGALLCLAIVALAFTM